MIKKILIIFSFLTSTILLAQYDVKGTFTPAEEFNFAILYKVTPTTSIYVNNTEINEEGQFTFQLDSTITQGMYRIVYALPQEEYNFDFIYDAKEDIELKFNLEDGVNYLSSKENILLSSYAKSLDLISRNIQAFYNQEKQPEKQFHHLFNTLRDTQIEFENASKNTIAHHFIKASRPYIPSTFEDAKTYSTHLKTSYFKYIDFNNPILQSSDFLINAVLNYVFTFVDEDQDNAFKQNIDTITKAIGDINPILKKLHLEILWNQFADAKNEVIANYIADNYLINMVKKDTKLLNIIKTFKNISTGNIAPNFQWKTEEGTETLYELKDSETYIIAFWSSTCSHCLEELPHLQDYVKSIKKEQLQVIAIGLEDEPYRWKDKTYDLPSFIHIYGEGKWDNKIGNAYGVTATPSYFILDADKKIIHKPNDFKAFKDYFDKNPIKIDKPEDKSKTKDSKKEN